MYDVVFYWQRPDLWKTSEACEGFFRQDDGADHWPVQILEASGLDETVAAVKTLNNCYAGVWEKDGKLFILADHIRSIPLYYSIGNNTVSISDNAVHLAQVLSLPIDPWKEKEFASSGFVGRGRTLYEGIAGTRAGELIVIDLYAQTVSSLSHFSTYNSFETFGDESAFDDLMLEGFGEIAKSLEGKTVLLSLSGGHDSRAIATMLKRVGVHDVLCFSYGYEGSREAEIAKNLASALGFPWKSVCFTLEEMRAFRTSEEWKKLVPVLFHGDSYHFPAAVIALKKVLQYVDDPGQCVYMPGHIIEDAFLTIWDDIKRPQSFNDIMVRNWFGMRKVTECTKMQCANWFDPWHQLQSESDRAVSCAAIWRQECYPKLYCDDVRIAEYFGVGWRLPLMNRLLAGYFLRLDKKATYDRDFWYRYTDKFIKPYSQNVPYSDTVVDSHHGVDNHRKWISIVPKWVYALFRKLYYALSLNGAMDPVPKAAERIKAVLCDGALLSNYYIVNDFIGVLKKQERE